MWFSSVRHRGRRKAVMMLPTSLLRSEHAPMVFMLPKPLMRTTFVFRMLQRIMSTRPNSRGAITSSTVPLQTKLQKRKLNPIQQSRRTASSGSDF
ncbi:hypothetical protein MRB53_041728 [Persea americana]|nr:hypothetical protein MRB53_041728 [Persea americana]